MGLFSKKSKEFDLELPPPPPPISEKSSYEDDMELPPLPPLEQKESSFETLKNTNSKTRLPQDLNVDELEEELPPVPDLEELKGEMPPLREIGQNEIQRLEFPEMKEEEEIPAAPVEDHELPNIEEKHRTISEGPLFVNIRSYKDVIESINTIKSKAKDGEDCVNRLNEIKNQKDKYFEQLRVKLEDLQRKSLYIDKSLFEGGESL